MPCLSAAATSPRKIALAGCFAFTAGYADVVCLIRYKCFVSMMSGNLLEMGRSLIDEPLLQDGHLYFHHAAFILGLIICRMIGLFLRHKVQRCSLLGTVFVAPFLVLVVVGGEVADYCTPYSLYSSQFGAWPLAVVFGMQADASMKGVLGVPTMMATGHIQNLTYALMAKFEENRPLKTVKVGLHITVIICLCAGAITGATVNKYIAGTKFIDLQFTPVIVVLASLLVIESALEVGSKPQPNPVVAATTDSIREPLASLSLQDQDESRSVHVTPQGP